MPGKTWSRGNCPELQLVPTEGDMTWATEVMPVMVANALPTGYTPAVHQFLAQHFDYGRNLVVIDLLSMKQSHCGFYDIVVQRRREHTRCKVKGCG